MFTNLFYIVNGNPAGWHLSWTLDGADGLVNKILNGHIDVNLHWARAHAASQQELAAWLSAGFLSKPTAYDDSIKASDLQVKDLPECMVEDRHKYKAVPGGAFSVALHGPSDLLSVHPSISTAVSATFS